MSAHDELKFCSKPCHPVNNTVALCNTIHKTNMELLITTVPKSFNDGLWYKFNDQYVTPTSLEALESTFGTNQSSYFSHSNAYFLMYRLVNPELNETFMKVEEFPEHIHKMMQEIRDEERGVAEKKERELMVCKVRGSCSISFALFFFGHFLFVIVNRLSVCWG
ncbi:unnamed protein product [Trichobilharzia regenti]|nr:unnamed protein product [Trichobilharzia regenti]